MCFLADDSSMCFWISRASVESGLGSPHPDPRMAVTSLTVTISSGGPTRVVAQATPYAAIVAHPTHGFIWLLT